MKKLLIVAMAIAVSLSINLYTEENATSALLAKHTHNPNGGGMKMCDPGGGDI